LFENKEEKRYNVVMDIVPQLVANSIIAGAVYALIALGFSLVYRTTKFFNFVHGVLAAVGGYTVFFLTQTLGLHVSISIAGGVLFAGLVGYGLDKIVYLPLRKRGASNMVLLVASIGAFTVIQAVIAIFFTSQFQSFPDILRDQNIYHIAGAAITQIQLFIVLAAVLVTAGLVLFLNKTTFGKAIKAVSDDEEVAKIVGINTNRVIASVFFIGSAIAGLAGILIGFDTGLEPTMGLSLLLKGVVASIIGGIGSVYGVVLGAFLLGFVENFGIWKISGEWKDAIAFGLLILFLIFRPRGILGK